MLIHSDWSVYACRDAVYPSLCAPLRSGSRPTTRSRYCVVIKTILVRLMRFKIILSQIQSQRFIYIDQRTCHFGYTSRHRCLSIIDRNVNRNRQIYMQGADSDLILNSIAAIAMQNLFFYMYALIVDSFWMKCLLFVLIEIDSICASSNLNSVNRQHFCPQERQEIHGR